MKILIVMIVSIGALALIPLACAFGQDINNLPPAELPEKGNPKLDSLLNQLTQAERRSEADSFAEQHDIKLVGESVRVIIKCVSGQLEEATKAVEGAGARVEASYDNLLQVVTPITSLTTLADEPSIRFIRLPQQPLPGTTR
ncbi:hypothetical protein ACFLWI_00790 [Chloroflexota bacterium]